MKEKQDIGRAQETVGALQQQLAGLEAEFKAEAEILGGRSDPMTETLETVTVRPTKQNISVRLVALAWVPTWQDAQGTLTPAWAQSSRQPS
jgi:hypothetical protein